MNRLQRWPICLAGLAWKSPSPIAIQREIWFKLWGNMTMNPVSAITGATCDKILDDPLVTRFCLNIMAEAAQIGAVFGCPIEQSGEERNAVTRKLGAFKTSMLQDVEAGRSVELDAIVTAVQERSGGMLASIRPISIPCWAWHDCMPRFGGCTRLAERLLGNAFLNCCRRRNRNRLRLRQRPRYCCSFSEWLRRTRRAGAAYSAVKWPVVDRQKAGNDQKQ